MQKLASGFFNISGGAVGPHGDLYFVDAYWQRIHACNVTSNQLSTISDHPFKPVNLAADAGGNLLVISYSPSGAVFALDSRGKLTALKPAPVAPQPGKTIYLPSSDWTMNRDSLSRPVAQFISPDGTAVLPVGEDFLNGATSWGILSSPQIRAFGLDRAVPGKPFYVTDESTMRTWAADVNPDGSLANFRLFAEQGGESVTVDAAGNVYLAAGQVYVYDPAGKLIDTIEVPERPIQLLFGGPDRKTLFIAARTSLYSVLTKSPGR